MSIYHCSISNVSRAKGSSSTAALSYITGEKVRDERLGKTFYGFGRQERIESVGILLPTGAPEKFWNAAYLFNSIEIYEKADNARPAKKIEVALPRECDLALQKQIVASFIQKNITSEGYAAVYAIHHDAENHNPHAHILVPNRKINAQSQEWEKVKRKMEYALDENGERIPIIDPETGMQKTDKRNRKQWKRVSVEQNLLDQKEFLMNLREAWAQECNQHLSPDQQIDHRSNAERGIEYEPTIHEGYVARKLEEQGKSSDRVEINQAIKEKNRLLMQLKQLIQELQERLQNLQRAFGEIFQNDESHRSSFSERLKSAQKKYDEQRSGIRKKMDKRRTQEKGL